MQFHYALNYYLSIIVKIIIKELCELKIFQHTFEAFYLIFVRVAPVIAKLNSLEFFFQLTITS